MRYNLLYPRATAAMLAGTAFLWGVAVAAGDGSATGQVAAAAAQAAECAAASRVCVDVSLSAVENAMAARADAEAALLKAMRALDKSASAAAEKKLQDAATEVGSTWEAEKEIVDLAIECRIEAAEAQKEAEKLGPDRETASDVKRAGRHIEIAHRALKRAETLTDILKKKWLLPVIPRTAMPAGTTLTQPPASTPDGRR